MKLSEDKINAMNESFSYVPPHMRDCFILWIEKGIYPGSFGTAVIENDLKGAVGRADNINRECLHSIVAWFYNYAPAGCWGSVENVKDWEEKRRAA